MVDKTRIDKTGVDETGSYHKRSSTRVYSVYYYTGCNCVYVSYVYVYTYM